MYAKNKQEKITQKVTEKATVKHYKIRRTHSEAFEDQKGKEAKVEKTMLIKCNAMQCVKKVQVVLLLMMRRSTGAEEERGK